MAGRFCDGYLATSLRHLPLGEPQRGHAPRGHGWSRPDGVEAVSGENLVVDLSLEEARSEYLSVKQSLRWRDWHLKEAVGHLSFAESWGETARLALRKKIRQELVRS